MRLFLFTFLLIAAEARIITRFTASDVTAALNELVLLDVNGGGEDEVVVSFQNMASTHIFTHDNAPLPLFTSVSSRLTSAPTFKALEALQALYKVPDVHAPDANAPDKIAAANAFIDAIFGTAVIQSAWNFSSSAGLSPNDEAGFKQQLFDLWFGAFARGSSEGSSGFESVFVGELEGIEVVGLGNWYRFYLLEKAGNANYHGWFTRQKGVQLELQFEWDVNEAMMKSFLLGTSPEFEVAAYTICALAFIGDCNFVKNGEGVTLTVGTVANNGAIRIESVYPSMGAGGGTTAKPNTAKTTTKGVIVDGDLQKLVDEMRAADEDKPVDYTLDWGKPRSGSSDVSPGPLITYVNEALFQRPQYKALIELYEAEIFQPDVCAAEAAMTGFKKQYVTAVFDIFTNSSMFQMAYNYLKQIGVAGDWAAFKQEVYVLWFGTYSRCSGPLGSSGFEHVYIGEWKSTKVDGQHCWVKYYFLEKAGDINYYGYYSYDENLTGTFQYKWRTYLKNIGGFNLGTSPAFDFATFTVCALTTTGNNACKFKVDGWPIYVTTYTQACNEGTCLSTAYPSDS